MPADRDQMSAEQKTTGFLMSAAVGFQSLLLILGWELLGLVLPALCLGILFSVLTLRSEQILKKVQNGRTLLAVFSLGFAALLALSLLVENSRSVLLLQASRMVIIDAAFMGLGRLCGSIVAGIDPRTDERKGKARSRQIGIGLQLRPGPTDLVPTV